MKIVSAIIPLFLFVTALPLKAVNYAIDDGTPDGHISIGTGTQGLMLNAFQAQAGGSTINSLQIAFTNGDTPVSTSFDIILFSDPTNDGSPVDGVQAARLR